MNLDKYKFIAHRGLYNKEDIPENSMRAFENAMDKGYAIELDVNMTKDGHLVVFHDNSLKRMTGMKMDVTMLELSEIKKLKLLGTDNKIPTMEDVLLLVSGKVPLMIEIKSNNKPKETTDKLMSLLEKYEGEYVIESFNPRIINYLRKNYPDVIRGQLAAKNIREVKSKFMRFLLGKMVFNTITKPHFISYLYTDITENMYKKYKKKNIDVAVWTLREKDAYIKVKDKADMFIFEKEETIK